MNRRAHASPPTSLFIGPFSGRRKRRVSCGSLCCGKWLSGMPFALSSQCQFRPVPKAVSLRAIIEARRSGDDNDCGCLPFRTRRRELTKKANAVCHLRSDQFRFLHTFISVSSSTRNAHRINGELNACSHDRASAEDNTQRCHKQKLSFSSENCFLQYLLLSVHLFIQVSDCRKETFYYTHINSTSISSAVDFGCLNFPSLRRFAYRSGIPNSGPQRSAFCKRIHDIISCYVFEFRNVLFIFRNR